MKRNGCHVLTTPIQQLAVRVAQYIDAETAMQPIIDFEDGQWTVRAHKRHGIITIPVMQHLADVAAGIEWQFRHHDDLLPSVTQYPTYFQYLNNCTGEPNCQCDNCKAARVDTWPGRKDYEVEVCTRVTNPYCKCPQCVAGAWPGSGAK